MHIRVSIWGNGWRKVERCMGGGVGGLLFGWGVWKEYRWDVTKISKIVIIGNPQCRTHINSRWQRRWKRTLSGNVIEDERWVFSLEFSFYFLSLALCVFICLSLSVCPSLSLSLSIQCWTGYYNENTCLFSYLAVLFNLSLYSFMSKYLK